MLLLLLPAPLQPRHPGVGTVSFSPTGGGDATPGQESPPGAAEEFISIFIGGKPTAVRVYRATGLRYRHHSMQATTATHTQGPLGSGSWASGAPQTSGAPQCSTGTRA